MIDVETLLEAAGLKDVPRTGWVRRGVDAPESVAAHTWGVAWLVLVLLPAELDRGRALAYAVLHDLPEVRTGDLTPADGVTRAEKAAAEHRAIAGLLATHPRLRETWEAYEAQGDPESRFVRELDRLDMAIQAVVYAERAGLDPTEFLDSAAAVVRDPVLAPVLSALRARTGR